MKKVFILLFVISALFSTDLLAMDIDSMMLALKESKKGINSLFASIDKDLALASGKLARLDLLSAEARQVLNGLTKDRDYLIDAVIVDPTGKMIVIEPPQYSKYEGSDIGRQGHIAMLLKYKKPVLSEVFHSVEGTESIAFNYPLISDKQEFLGSVSLLVKQAALSEDIIVPLVKNLPCKAWVMQKDGLIIYDPDPDQIGRNIFQDDLFKPFVDLIQFSRTVAMAEEGAGSYDFYAKGLGDKTLVKKYAVWDTVSLYGRQWRIVVMESEQPPPVKENETSLKK